jgi:hypothetical protein
MLTVLGIVACEKADSKPGSCFKPQDNVCIDYAAAQSQAGKRLCAGMPWSDAPCSPTNRLGLCKKSDGTSAFYSGAPNNYTAAGAKSACEQGGGTWAP